MIFVKKLWNFALIKLPSSKLRKYCVFKNVPKSFAWISVIELRAKNDINTFFSKGNVSANDIYNLLETVTEKMNLYSNSLTKSLIDEIWLNVHKNSIKVNIKHFNITMQSFLKNDIDFNPLTIMKEINESNISFDNTTFELLFEKFCKLGDLNSAMKLFNKFIELKLKINSRIYALLIGCAIRANDLEEIEKYYNALKEKKFTLTHANYSFIAESYASQLDVDNCIKVYDKCESDLHSYDKLLLFKYSSFYELAKAQANDELLLSLLKYINQRQQKTVIMKMFQKLNRSGLYSASNLLVKNVELDWTSTDFKTLLQWFVILQPPFEHLEFLLSRISDPKFDNFLIKYLYPLEEAIKIADKRINDMDKPHNKAVVWSLIKNAKNYPDSISKINHIFNYLHNKLGELQFNRYLINFGIGELLFDESSESHFNFISNFTTDGRTRMNFISCVLYHIVCKGKLSDAENLLSHYPNVKEFSFKYGHSDFIYILMKDKALKDVCQRILFLKKAMNPSQYRVFLRNIICEFASTRATEDLVTVLDFMKKNLILYLTDEDLVYLEHNLKYNQDQLGIIKNEISHSVKNARY